MTSSERETPPDDIIWHQFLSEKPLLYIPQTRTTGSKLTIAEVALCSDSGSFLMAVLACIGVFAKHMKNT